MTYWGDNIADIKANYIKSECYELKGKMTCSECGKLKEDTVFDTQIPGVICEVCLEKELEKDFL